MNLLLNYLAIMLIVLTKLSSSYIIVDDNDNNNGNGNAGGKSWVLLCAGSAGWNNYGDQATMYHAYHTIRARGIPDENIVVMHTDDLANHPQNPTPGIVVNQPNGRDVYKGVPKDYTGRDVNPDTFLRVLRGDRQLATLGKKVIASGPMDNIFVLFGDHGSTEEILFPNDYLSAKKLNQALVEMYQAKKFNKLFIMLDTCDSGSMFNYLLPNNIDVYAITSSRPDELSWFYNYDEKRDTFVGSFLSYNWLENLENNHDTIDNNNNNNKETIGQQYQYFVQHSNVTINYHGHISHEQEHAQQYGNLNIAKMQVGEFLGKNSIKVNRNNNNNNNANNLFGVNKWDSDIYLAEMRVNRPDNTVTDKLRYITELRQLVNDRQLIDRNFERYVNSIKYLLTDNNINSVMQSTITTNKELTNRDCYYQLVDTFHTQCLSLNQNPYVLRKLKIFVNICQQFKANNTNNTKDLQLMANIASKQLQDYCRQNSFN